MPLDLKMLGQAFSYFKEEEFDKEEYCDNECGDRYHECECCGNYSGCEITQSDCSELKEAEEQYKKKYEKKVIEVFNIENIYGFDMAINISHYFGIWESSEEINTEYLNKRFKTQYLEINKSVFIEKEGVIPKEYEIPENKHSFLKRVIDSSFNLIKNPKILFAPERPMIIQDKKYSIIISPKYPDKEEAES